MSDGPGGIFANFTDDGWRDAYALVVAFLHDDVQGQAAVLDNTDLRSLASTLAALTSGTVTSLVTVWAGDAYGALTPEQATDLAKMILIGGLRGAGLPEPPMPPSVAADDPPH